MNYETKDDLGGIDESNRRPFFKKIILIVLAIFLLVFLTMFVFRLQKQKTVSDFVNSYKESKDFENQFESAEPSQILSTVKKSKISYKKESTQKQVEENNSISSGSSGSCLYGTDCQDNVSIGVGINSYSSCTLDTDCAFFTGFTGTETLNKNVNQNTVVQSSAPKIDSGSVSVPGGGLQQVNSPVPDSTTGSSGCFNKVELLKQALNKDKLQEDQNVICECGIEPPSHSVTGTPSSKDGVSGEVNSGTISDIENEGLEVLSCMRPQVRPDIETYNFVFPEEVDVNNPFLISFDYKNVGVVDCQSSYFEINLTKLNTGGFEDLGGGGMVISYFTPLKPGDDDTFTIGSQLFSGINSIGNYQLDMKMHCEMPKETHVSNNIKTIYIKAK